MREDEEKRQQGYEAGQSLNKKHQEELIDESLEETFPASDPPSHIRIEGELQKDRLGNTRDGSGTTRQTESSKKQVHAGTSTQPAPENQKENKIDEAIDETFPASDPPASHHVEGEVKPEQVEENKNKTAAPKKPEKTDKKETQRAKEKERAGH